MNLLIEIMLSEKNRKKLLVVNGFTYEFQKKSSGNIQR